MKDWSMLLSKPLVGAIKSTVICLPAIAQARPFYEGLLGLRVISETNTISDKARRLWGLNERQLRCLRIGKPGEHFGMFDLVEIPGKPAEPIRDPQRPWDYGWLTLSLKTSHLERALATVSELGAQMVSKPYRYEAGGKQVREV